MTLALDAPPRDQAQGIWSEARQHARTGAQRGLGEFQSTGIIAPLLTAELPMTTFSALELRNGVVSFFGAADFDERADGISPRRLPAWTRAQVPKPMDVMLRMPSGVRMAFSTNASELRLLVQTTRMTTPPEAPRPAVFDLLLNGELRSEAFDRGNVIQLDRRDPTQFELVRGDAYEVLFSDLGTNKKHCEIWLPHNAFVELRSLTLSDDATLFPAPIPRERRWLHYGSSISHCMEATQPTGVWPAVAARKAGMHLQSLGFGGQCLLDQFVARTIRDSDADVISLKVGINVVNGDFMRERVFTSALHGFLDTIRDGKANTPIVLVSPIFCPSAETHPGPTVPNAEGRFVTLRGHEAIQNGSLTLTRVREIIRGLVDARSSAGDAHLHYLDGLQLFNTADASDLPDDLHPNPAGYARMGERFASQVFGSDGLLRRARARQ